MTAAGRDPEPVDVDVLVVGAGPVGLFGAYCAGFRGLRVALIDTLPEVGRGRRRSPLTGRVRVGRAH